ncbi:MAG: RNA methyltransferase [Chloroflexi bacterium]|nr:RNA methyltransferase [Chloroflexota bacterium]
MELITSRSNPKVKQVRLLKGRHSRQPGGAFLVEGIRHMGEAADAAQAGRIALEAIYYAPDLLKSSYALDLVAAQQAAGLPCHALSAEVFASLAEKDNPQGILAVAAPRPLSLEDLNPQNFPWGVALVAPQDPGNVGAILRTLDAVGASGLLLLDSTLDAYHPAAVRASMGAIFWLPAARASFAEFTAWAQGHGYAMYGSSAHASQDARGRRYPRPLILLLGSERQGLTPEQAAVCRHNLRLPMRGRATSLNLAVAAGVMLYAMLED